MLMDIIGFLYLLSSISLSLWLGEILENMKEQAGAELCQAQVKLGYSTSSISLPFNL